jgi:signal transduction histidine kinase
MMPTAVSNTLQTLMDAQEFLFKTISILAESPSFSSTIDSLARLANSTISDWCALFVLENENSLRRLFPSEGIYPLDFRASSGPGYVLRTGKPKMFPKVGNQVLEGLGLPPGAPAFRNGERPEGCLYVPVIARGRTIGSIAFLTARSDADFMRQNLPLAEALASAAAVALDHAELFRKVQEANRLKEEFVATVSHELRTPLTPILGCIHLLRTTNLNQSNFDRALQMIEKNAQAQVRIVEDLLDASRIVAGKLHLVMRSVQLVPVLEAAVESVRPSAQGKGLKILTSFEDIRQPVDGDANRLQQIVWHLLSNAVKFTPPEGQIEVSLKSESDYVVIQVADTGIGIPPDSLPHIFDRFRQAADNESKLPSGLGFGLAIVRHLVELHNGSIEASSAGRDRGALFTVRFPFAAERAMAVGNSEI